MACCDVICKAKNFPEYVRLNITCVVPVLSGGVARANSGVCERRCIHKRFPSTNTAQMALQIFPELKRHVVKT